MSGALDDHPLFRTRLAGTTLVEASAGTGKTWTMAGLYARLVLEQALEPRAILAVTYTRAATAELKSRIRALLASVADRLAPGARPADDILVEALVARVDDLPAARRAVAAALASFDEAMINTIHGFCQRALAEAAFESALPFEVELVTDESRLLAEIAEDFWRVRTEALPRPFAQYVAARGMTPARLVAQAKVLLGAAAGEPIAPDPESFDDAAFAAAYDEASNLWRIDRDAIVEELETVGWSSSSVRAAVREVERWVQRGWPTTRCGSVTIAKQDYPALARFASSVIAAQLAGKARPPTHPFFRVADDLLRMFGECDAAYPKRVQQLVIDFARVAREQLDRRKRETGRQAYDDLLTRLADALAGPGGPALAERLRERYRAALVDEFQDTDRVQYGIFDRIFAKGALPLVMVGDPKQAIYAFRGADVFTYLAAARDADKLALDQNRRSVPPLVRAVNAVFDVPQPFAVDAIGFQPARPLEDDAAALTLPVRHSPVTLWWAQSDGKPLGKSDFGPRVIDATADEIVRLLAAGRDGSATVKLKGRTHPLGGRDIAVLVRTNREASDVRAALAARGVASVTFGQSSVLASDEAAAFGRVLAAVADPLNGGLVRGALATPLFGVDAARLIALREDVAAWEAWIETFQRYHKLLHAAGPMRLWREIVREQGVVARLGGRIDGARALANYRHLAELLHREALERDLDPAALAEALARRRAAEAGVSDEELLRLESEEDLVRILTIHVSKGLEFPIVFCPFLWDGKLSAERAATVAFHDPDDGRLRLDFGSAQMDAHRALALAETMGEQLRLAYVAFTRAALKLYVAHGTVNGVADSPLAWLFHREDTELPPAEAHARLRQRFGGTPHLLAADLANLARRSGDTIEIVPLPAVAANETFAAPAVVAPAAPAGGARVFSRGGLAARRLTSFSAIVAGGTAETPDHDAFARRALDEGPDADDPAFRFPAGAREGSALHALFEALDFPRAAPADVERAARRVLPQFGIAETWAGAAAHIVGHALDARLDESGLSLRTVEGARRRMELEFAYPVGVAVSRTLRELVAEHRAAAGLPVEGLAAFDPRVVPGFMKGFIDLVFEHGGRYYIADYKSNLLGRTLAAYTAPRVAAAVAEELYDLQYLVYTVALDRLLAWRLPGYDYERHFGGVFYLFLRGMRADARPGAGVFAARPAAALVRRLASVLDGGRR
jgi:exodeoxyribonuclease V beta subunit